jgi:hypothetical protein
MHAVEHKGDPTANTLHTSARDQGATIMVRSTRNDDCVARMVLAEIAACCVYFLLLYAISVYNRGFPYPSIPLRRKLVRSRVECEEAARES